LISYSGRLAAISLPLPGSDHVKYHSGSNDTIALSS